MTFVKAKMNNRTDIYPADEEPIPGVSAALIVEAVRPHRPVTFIAEGERVVGHLLPMLRPEDLVLTLTAPTLETTNELMRHRHTAVILSFERNSGCPASSSSSRTIWGSVLPSKR